MPISSNYTFYAISTGEYTNGNNNLPGVKNSMERLIKLLQKYSNDEHKDNIKWSHNKTHTEASREFNEFLNSYEQKDKETLIIYFCGHGYLISEKEELLLSTTDTSPEGDETGIGIRCGWILSRLNKCKIQRYILILDCCCSAVMSSMGNSQIDIKRIQEENLHGGAILTATNNLFKPAKELEIGGELHAAFTFFLTDALKNQLEKAERNKRNVTLKGIYNDLISMIKKSQNSSYIPNPQLKCTSEIQDIPLFTYRDSVANRSTRNREFSLLLVKSAIDFPIKDYDFGVPLGLWLLKSYFDLQGTKINVQIYDERLELRKGSISKFEDIIQDYDMVGVSICSCEVPPAIEKLRIAKQKGKITFVGGIFCSSNEKYLLEYSCIDYVIPGVSTVPLYKLSQELAKQSYVDEHGTVDYITGVITKKNLDNLTVWKPSQLPDIELRTWKEIVAAYGKFLDGKIDVFTTRGCNRHCAFCSVQKECQQRIYQRDEKSIIKEVIVSVKPPHDLHLHLQYVAILPYSSR